MCRIMVLAGILTLSQLSYAELLTPEEPNSRDEPWLYETYNTLFQTDLRSSADLIPLETNWDKLPNPSSYPTLEYKTVWRNSYLTDTVGTYSTGQLIPITGPWRRIQNRIYQKWQKKCTEGQSEIGFYELATFEDSTPVLSALDRPSWSMKLS